MNIPAGHPAQCILRLEQLTVTASASSCCCCFLWILSLGYRLTVVQAAGSSLLAKLTNLLTADALRIAGLADLGEVTVLPLATGMAMTTMFLALKTQHASNAARYVIWPRIDQKTCLKAITAAGKGLMLRAVRETGPPACGQHHASASCALARIRTFMFPNELTPTNAGT